MSEIKNVGYTWMAKRYQLTPLPFKGLKTCPPTTLKFQSPEVLCIHGMMQVCQ